jgi:hypothetical protein
MKMTKLKMVSASLLTVMALAASQAGAVTFEGATGHAANVVVDYSTHALLAFDIDFHQLSAVTLNFRVEADDLISPEIGFNSLVRDLTGLGFPKLNVGLEGGVSFAAPAGTVTTDGFSAVSVLSQPSSIQATFSPALTSEFYIGNPLLAAGATDWKLSLAGRQAGDAFAVTVAVPEPETAVLVAGGLLIAAAVARRRSLV